MTEANELAEAAKALLDDVRARYPGEALRCPHMIRLDEAVSSLAPKPDTTPDGVREALAAFDAALAAMPIGADRIAKGQQFNAYESAANDEDEDPADWEFYLSLGPITDCILITGIEGEWRAKLIEAALRVAMRSRTALTQSPRSCCAEEGVVIERAAVENNDTRHWPDWMRGVTIGGFREQGWNAYFDGQTIATGKWGERLLRTAIRSADHSGEAGEMVERIKASILRVGIGGGSTFDSEERDDMATEWAEAVVADLPRLSNDTEAMRLLRECRDELSAEYEDGCRNCLGDCSSANPTPLFCPPSHQQELIARIDALAKGGAS